MTSLSTAAALAAARPYAQPIYFFQFDFTAPGALTLYLYGGELANDSHNALGHEWQPLVLDCGAIASAMNTTDLGGGPATFTLRLANTRAISGKTRVSDLIYTPLNTTGTYVWEFAKVTVTQLFKGLGIPDKVTLGVFYIEDQQDLSDVGLAVRMSDQSMAIENKMAITTISADDFPNAADDAIGQDIPVMVGTFKRMPGYLVVTGATTKLAADITATDLALTLTDSDSFPQADTIWIDGEAIGTASINTTTDVVTVAKRGKASGGPAAPHKAGATVIRLLTGANAYVYVVAENSGGYKHKAVTKVKLNGIKSSAGTVSLSNTTLVVGKDYVTVSFPGPPVVNGKVVLPGGTAKLLATNRPALTTTDENSFDKSYPLEVRFEALSPLLSPELVTRHLILDVTAVRSDSWTGYSISRRNESGGNTVLESGTGPTAKPRAKQRRFQWTTGKSLHTEVITLRIISANDAGVDNFRVTDFFVDVKTLKQDGTGSDSVLGALTCDVQGIQDDVTGTISGTPSLLLENPTDVSRFALTALFGVAAVDLGTSWAASRALHAAGSYKLAGLIRSSTFAAWRTRVATQSRCLFYLSGGLWQWKFLVDAPAADATLTYSKDLRTEGAGTFRRTSRQLVKNRLKVYSQRDWTKSGSPADTYRRMHKHEDLAQPGLTAALTEPVELDLIQDATTADLIGAWLLGKKKRQRWEGEGVAVFHPQLALDIGDYIAISAHPVLANQGDTTLIHQIRGITERLDEEMNTVRELKLVEANA